MYSEHQSQIVAFIDLVATILQNRGLIRLASTEASLALVDHQVALVKPIAQLKLQILLFPLIPGLVEFDHD